jgi:hypothetical protein
MKQYGANVEIAKRGNYLDLPPVGAYVAEIKNVRVVEPDGERRFYPALEMMVDIVEGEYANRYTEVYNDQKERFDNAKYKGIFSLRIPTKDDKPEEDWVSRKFGNNIWCVQESNPGYTWDLDEKKLKGKKVGINIRRKLYIYDNQEKETTEIGQFETVEDVKAGKCKRMKDNDRRKSSNNGAASTDGSSFTEVSGTVDVPW